jgi:hypothetical protein
MGAEAGVGVEGVAGGWEVVVLVLDGPPGAGGAVVGAEAGAGVEGPAEAVAVEAAATGLACGSQVNFQDENAGRGEILLVMLQ